MTTHSLRTLLAATLTLLPACDPDDLDHTAWDEVEFRCNPLFSTCAPTNNTPFTGALNLSPLDTTGATFQNIRVDKAGISEHGGRPGKTHSHLVAEGQIDGMRASGIHLLIGGVVVHPHLTGWHP